MARSTFLGSTALKSAAAAGLMVALASPAWAQQTTDKPATADTQATPAPMSQTDPNTPQAQGKSSSNAAQAVPEEKEVAGSPAAAQGSEGDTVIVTGSRIARPNLQSTVPITSVTGAQLEQTATVAVGDVLNQLPQLGNTFNQSNSTRFLGTAGLNLLDLYQLGTQRTLVLVNGRRHVGSDILNNGVSPDVNTFPTDLIDRVDVVTGGQSAVYGSDAIAGVVNFVLKDHFDGLQAHAQGGVSEHGDAGAYFASILGGKNFGGGRGNIALDLEYAHQSQLVASQRAYYNRANGFVTVDTDPAGTPNGSDGVPDRILYPDVRSATISLGGNVLFPTPAGQNRCGVDKNGAAFSCSYIFQPDGTLIPQTGVRVGLAPNGAYLGGNGNTEREGDLVQLQPQLDRYAANLIGHYDISPAFTPFIEAKFVRTNVFGTGGSGPAFFQGSTLDANLERPRLDNPYLSDQARTLITQQILATGLNPATGAALTAANLANIANGSFRFALRENLLDLGVRAEASQRDTYRIVGGVRGNFFGDWHYEVAANYGEFDEKTQVQGNLNVQRFLLALDSTRNAAGQIVCRSQLPGTAGTTAAAAAAAATGDPDNLLAADVAACQPLNPFGYNNVSAAARNYVLQNTTSVGKITQFDVTASVAGDLSKLFSLPGGPIGFSFGGEYRRETNQFNEDPLVQDGYTFYNAIAAFNPPSFEVKEGFGEVRVPLLKDFFLAHELTLSGAFRASGYKGIPGTIFAYNGGVDWFPISDIHFRGNYARAVRAPNLSELYSPQSQNFAPGFSDPCAANQIGQGTQYRAANCAAQGINVTGANPYNYIYQQSLEIVSGGNPNLKPEFSDSYTAGVVIQPRFARGFSASVDYYDITVNNVITAPSAQGIVNSCYDAPVLSPVFCPLFQRDNAQGTVTGTPFRIIEASLQQTLLNYARLHTRGLNTEITANHSFSPDFNLGGRFTWTHQFENVSFTDPTQPNFGDTIVGEIGSPKDRFNVNVDAKVHKVFVNYELRYLSRQSVTAYEDLNSFEGRPPNNQDYANILYYHPVTYHDIRVGLNITDKNTFYFGVDNFTDSLPPLYSTGIGGGTGIFENVGRRFYAGANVRF